jgi:pimeloyl-ACP methyl ester carboxylesterase
MITTVAISSAAALVLAAAGVLAYRARCQRRTARSLAIGTPDGISESGYVRIGGIDQWVQIRGEDRANQVLLFLHGAGMSMTPFTPVFRSWEKHFTVVQWDRRGVGGTLARNGRHGSEQWTFGQAARDGIEVAEYLCRHLGAGQVILVGHSQGSIVGMEMARLRPGLFRAYVGTGQIIDMERNEPVSYQLAVARAEGRGKAARELSRLGAPPYARPRTWILKQKWSFDTDSELRAWSKKAMRMVLTAPGMSLADLYRFNSAIMFYPQALYDETMSWTAPRRFGVPVYLLQGDTDAHTLTSLVEEYYPAVEAPAKDLVLIPGGGHCAVLMQPAAFLAALGACVGGPASRGTVSESAPGTCDPGSR